MSRKLQTSLDIGLLDLAAQSQLDLFRREAPAVRGRKRPRRALGEPAANPASALPPLEFRR